MRRKMIELFIVFLLLVTLVGVPSLLLMLHNVIPIWGPAVLLLFVFIWLYVRSERQQK